MATPIRHKRWLSAVIICLCGCESAALRHPEALYNAAERSRREGDWSTALAQAERGRNAWRNPSSSWYWKFRLLAAEVLLSQGKVDKAVPLLLPPSGEGPGSEELQARLLANRGQAAYVTGKYPEAMGLLDQALALAAKSPLRSLEADIELRRATIWIRQSKFAEAERELRSAIATSQDDAYLQANALGTRGFLLLNQHRFDEGVQWFERTLAVAEPARYYGITTPTLNNLGWCYYRLGDFDKATGYLTKAAALAARMEKRPSQQIALGLLGDVRYTLHDYNMALEYYRQALAVSESLHEDFWRAKWLSNMATTLIAAGDPASAEPYNRRALEVQTRRDDQAARLWPMLNGAHIAALKHEYRQAESSYQDVLISPVQDATVLWEAHAGLADLYVKGQEPDKARLAFLRANESVEQMRSQLLKDESKLTFYGSLFEHYGRYVDFLMDQHQPDQALAFVESRRARLLTDNMNSRGSVPPSADFRVLANRLHAVLLSYWLSKNRSYVWITTSGETRWATLPGEPEIRLLVDQYLHAVHDLRDPVATRQPAARQLYSILIGPVADLIPKGARVIVAPDGCLHRLNFETLITPAGYWIEDVSVQVAPSLALLGANSGVEKKARNSILLVGDPVPKAPDFPALPSASQEIREIENLFPEKRVLTRSDANVQAYRDAKPGGFRMIHFAAHALANQSDPLDSAVILSPEADEYKLYAREVKDSTLSADLVTISGCQSAGARAYSGEGLVGFAWAFLSAGARNVVASLWDVSDASTSSLMAGFYERLRNGESAAAALRGAKLDFIRSEGPRRKPYYWAAFQLYRK
jgi:CHAT domain-containing protein/Tfp pilus assembly protein PilF